MDFVDKQLDFVDKQYRTCGSFRMGWVFLDRQCGTCSSFRMEFAAMEIELVVTGLGINRWASVAERS